ncbi:hypothetical protein [Jiangella asiatica]|nr:hypothetical protein [Jiangella asiatica]
MEILGLALSLVFLYGLYHVIRTGVRDGIREAMKDQVPREAGTDPKS